MILARIKRRGAGTIVVPGDSLDLGSRQAIGVALHRMEKSGAIRRLARGVYDLPVTRRSSRDAERITKLKQTIPVKERIQLLKDLPLAPAWMHAHLLRCNAIIRR